MPLTKRSNTMYVCVVCVVHSYHKAWGLLWLWMNTSIMDEGVVVKPTPLQVEGQSIPT